MLRSGSMIVPGVMGIEVIERCLMYLLDVVESRVVSLVSKDLLEVRKDVRMMEWMNVMVVIMRMLGVVY